MVGAARLELLPGVCDRAIAEKGVPGGVLLVGRHGETLCELAFGARAVVPERSAATVDTIYDWASLTKPVVTATLFMQALEEGRVHLHEPLSRWLPIPSCNAIGDATPRQLLLHVSGLPAGRPLPTGKLSLNALVGALVEGGLENPPESVFTYSDIGFHLLAALVETVFERPLDELARDRILNPIGMVDTDFGVPPEKICRVAPTEMAGETMLCGQVHDPAARSLGGVAGHAGLFGTARDLARFCRMVLGRGQVDGIRILQSATLDAMIAPVEIPGGNMRALGWDVDTRYSNPRGDILPVRGVGHTGFTGPSFWIDPATGIFIILATNRLHPDGKGDAVALRRRVANVVAAALLD